MRSAIDRGRRIPPRPAHFRRRPESDFLRIKLAANRPNPQFGAFLRCHKACEIGRAGPDCDHLSAELQRRKTRWRRGADSNPRYRELTHARNLAGAWRIIRPEQKRLCWREICSPEIRLYFGSLRFAAVRQNDATIRVMLDSQRLPDSNILFASSGSRNAVRCARAVPHRNPRAAVHRDSVLLISGRVAGLKSEVAKLEEGDAVWSAAFGFALSLPRGREGKIRNYCKLSQIKG
jgi:hypothetical protein